MHKIGQFILITLILVSCQGIEDVDNHEKTNFEVDQLIKVDSILIDILGRISLLDVADDASSFLLLDFSREEYLVWYRLDANFSSSFKVNTEKEHAGYTLRMPSFYKSSELLFGGLRGVVIYDLSGNILRYYPHEKPVFPRIFYTLPANFIYAVNNKGKEQFLFPPVKPITLSPAQSTFYQEWRCLSLFDPESGQMEDIIPLPEDSRYFDGMAYNYSHLKTTYTVVDDTLWLNIGGDNVLRAYTVGENFKPIGAITLSMQNYNLPDALDPKNLDLNNVINYNQYMQGVKSIFAYGEDIAFVYFPGLSKSQKESLLIVKDADSPEVYREFAQQLFESIPSRLQIITKRGEIKFDIGIPIEFKAFELIIRDKQIWVQKKEDQEEEEDYVILYRLDVQ